MRILTDLLRPGVQCRRCVSAREQYVECAVLRREGLDRGTIQNWDSVMTTSILRATKRRGAAKNVVSHQNDPPGAQRCRQCGSRMAPCTRCFFRWCDEGLFAQTTLACEEVLHVQLRSKSRHAARPSLRAEVPAKGLTGQSLAPIEEQVSSDWAARLPIVDLSKVRSVSRERAIVLTIGELRSGVSLL